MSPSVPPPFNCPICSWWTSQHSTPDLLSVLSKRPEGAERELDVSDLTRRGSLYWVIRGLTGATTTISRLNMFYSEFPPSAMKWPLHNPHRIYSNFVFPNCAKQFQDENDQNFGKLWVYHQHKLFVSLDYHLFSSSLKLLPGWMTSKLIARL